jgi:hypothetical protein
MAFWDTFERAVTHVTPVNYEELYGGVYSLVLKNNDREFFMNLIRLISQTAFTAQELVEIKEVCIYLERKRNLNLLGIFQLVNEDIFFFRLIHSFTQNPDMDMIREVCGYFERTRGVNLMSVYYYLT